MQVSCFLLLFACFEMSLVVRHLLPTDADGPGALPHKPRGATSPVKLRTSVAQSQEKEKERKPSKDIGVQSSMEEVPARSPPSVPSSPEQAIKAFGPPAESPSLSPPADPRTLEPTAKPPSLQPAAEPVVPTNAVSQDSAQPQKVCSASMMMMMMMMMGTWAHPLCWIMIQLPYKYSAGPRFCTGLLVTSVYHSPDSCPLRGRGCCFSRRSDSLSILVSVS